MRYFFHIFHTAHGVDQTVNFQKKILETNLNPRLKSGKTCVHHSLQILLLCLLFDFSWCQENNQIGSIRFDEGLDFKKLACRIEMRNRGTSFTLNSLIKQLNIRFEFSGLKTLQSYSNHYIHSEYIMLLIIKDSNVIDTKHNPILNLQMNTNACHS